MTSMQTLTQKPTLNPALRDFWMTKARNKILYGGRSSSKSWDAAGFAIYLADNYKLRFLCVRQIQNKIEQSVYALLKIQIERFGLQSRFKITDNKIINTYTGAEFMFYGLWRHIDEVKSLESIDVLWSEESHGLTEAQWEVLEPTIRKEGSECWLLFNPNLATDFVYKNFVVNPPPNTITRLINYTENPFLSDTILDVIEAAKDRDYDQFEHVYLGVPRDDDDSVIIKRSWIEAAIDAHLTLNIEPRGKKTIGFDVADSGSDKCATGMAHGSIFLGVEEWQAGEDELLKSTSKVYALAKENRASIVYDSIGVGASVGAKLNELNFFNHSKFNAGGKVNDPDRNYQPNIKNKDFFSNVKAQAWWTVRDRFINTYNAIHKGEKFNDDELISISSDCKFLDQLKDELSTPKRDFDNNGRVKVESKKDLLKRGIKSPNIADAFIMSLFSVKQTDWSKML